jgi:hypothetical protein
MRATVMYGAHDVRVETVPDARLIEPTDALVRVTRAHLRQRSVEQAVALHGGRPNCSNTQLRSSHDAHEELRPLANQA